MGRKTVYSKLKRTENKFGWFFVAPATILFLVFMFIPILQVIYYSFTEWDGMSQPVFVGLANFIELFQSDVFYKCITNNFKFLILGVPLWTFFPLVIAVLLFEEVKGWKFFRSAFFFPTVLSVVVTGTLFKTMFDYNGVVNEMFRSIGLDIFAKEWWATGATAIPLMVIIMNWVGFGTAMLIYLAGMSNISESVIEASYLDGANWFQRFRYIFLPELKGLIQLQILLNVLYCFTSLFGYIYVMTKGGPGYETTVIEYLVYQKAFTSREMGYASALSVVLALIVSAISLIQFKFFRGKN